MATAQRANDTCDARRRPNTGRSRADTSRPVAKSAMSAAKTDPYLVKYVSLVVLTLQTTVLVLTLRYSRLEPPQQEATTDQDYDQQDDVPRPDQRYLSSTAIVMSEAIKILVCLVILGRESGSIWSLVAMLNREVIGKPHETVKLLVPAFLYTVQNNLLFLALTNLDAATYQVTYQLKILTTALFSVWMLHKRLNMYQWLSLVMLMVGVSLVQWPTDEDGLENEALTRQGNQLIGLTAVLISCLSSGFSGVYFERLVKVNSQQSLWMRNVQLAVFGLICASAACLVQDGNRVAEDGFFQGYDSITWVVIFLQAFGGLTVAIVMKYADNILKGFATSVSIILSTITSYYLLGDVQPSALFMLGTGVVISATFLYAI